MKSADEIERYYAVFKKKWKELSEYPRIKARIEEGEAKRNKRSNLETLLTKKITSVRYPMQELELNYPTTKGKVYSEEEDRYLLCRLYHYGMRTDDVYERIKKDITEFPVFRFDWFFKSRSPQELQRRCNTLLGMIEKEAEAKQAEEVKVKGVKGKVRTIDARRIERRADDVLQKRGLEEVKAEDEASRASTPGSITPAAAPGAPGKRAYKRKKT